MALMINFFFIAPSQHNQNISAITQNTLRLMLEQALRQNH